MLVSNVKEKALQDEVQLETYRCELKRLMEWVRAHGNPEIRSKQRCDDQRTRSFDPWASKDQGQGAFIVKQPALLCNLVLLKPYTSLCCWYEFTSTSNWNCLIRPKAHPKSCSLEESRPFTRSHSDPCSCLVLSSRDGERWRSQCEWLLLSSEPATPEAIMMPSLSP